MNKLDNFLKQSSADQTAFLTLPGLDRDDYNYVLSNFYSNLENSVLAAAIEINGHKLDASLINNLINLDSEDVMTAIASNSQIVLNNDQIRDMTRLVDDDIIKQHPNYSDFWYTTFVQSEEEFLSHTLQHIKNTNILADEVLDFILEDNSLKEYFNIPQGIKNRELKTLIREGMLLHDQAKTSTDEEFLKEHGLEEPMYKTLYAHYGKGFTEELKPIVAKLNSIDKQIITDYLENFDEWKKELFFKIERIADCLERGCNKVTPEEMKQAKMKPSFFLEKKMHPTELKIVKFFEENYSNYCKEIF